MISTQPSGRQEGGNSFHVPARFDCFPHKNARLNEQFPCRAHFSSNKAFQAENVQYYTNYYASHFQKGPIPGSLS